MPSRGLRWLCGPRRVCSLVCLCAWCPSTPHSGIHWAFPVPGTHLPICLSPGSLCDLRSHPLNSPVALAPVPGEMLSLFRIFSGIKQMTRSPLGTLFFTPLRQTHKLFLECFGSFLSSLAGLPGCSAVACVLLPVVGEVTAIRRPRRPLIPAWVLVQTAASPAASLPHSDPDSQYSAPDLVPNGLHFFC